MAQRTLEHRHGSGRFLLPAAACALGALTLSCGPTSNLPGTALGTYNVTGTLGSNTCGSNLGAPNPWTFAVQLSEDTNTFYWEQTGGNDELSSTMTSSTAVNITSIQTANVDGSDAGEGPCDMTSTTTIDLTLAPGSPPSSFHGTITYTFAASTGVSSTTDCTDQLSASGGTYDTLPCTATYTIDASHQ